MIELEHGDVVLCHFVEEELARVRLADDVRHAGDQDANVVGDAGESGGGVALEPRPAVLLVGLHDGGAVGGDAAGRPATTADQRAGKPKRRTRELPHSAWK